MRHTPAHDLTVAEIDRQSLFHPFTALAEHQHAEPLVMDEAQGVWVRDLGGRRYLDAFAGLWCVNIGYGRAEVADAIAAQSKRLGCLLPHVLVDVERAADPAGRPAARDGSGPA